MALRLPSLSATLENDQVLAGHNYVQENLPNSNRFLVHDFSYILRNMRRAECYRVLNASVCLCSLQYFLPIFLKIQVRCGVRDARWSRRNPPPFPLLHLSQWKSSMSLELCSEWIDQPFAFHAKHATLVGGMNH